MLVAPEEIGIAETLAQAEDLASPPDSHRPRRKA
jgi:hypothetical protein